MVRLHGAQIALARQDVRDGAVSDDFGSVYADYADSVVKANAVLQEHGRRSAQFVAADVASMCLFHRAKKMQGLKKPKS